MENTSNIEVLKKHFQTEFNKIFKEIREIKKTDELERVSQEILSLKKYIEDNSVLNEKRRVNKCQNESEIL